MILYSSLKQNIRILCKCNLLDSRHTMCGLLGVHFLFIPVSVRGVKVVVWSQTSGAGTPHSVQRRLQVAAPPQHGSRERERERNRDGDKMYKDRGCRQRCQGEEIMNNVREQKGDEWEADKRKNTEKVRKRRKM